MLRQAPLKTSRSHVSKLLCLQLRDALNISEVTQSQNCGVQARTESGQNLYERDAWMRELFWEVLDVPP